MTFGEEKIKEKMAELSVTEMLVYYCFLLIIYYGQRPPQKMTIMPYKQDITAIRIVVCWCWHLAQNKIVFKYN